MTDSELVESIKNGDRKSFTVFMNKYSKQVFSTAMGFVHVKEDAEDLTQEVFIKVFRSISDFKGESGISTWLYRITVNVCINFVGSKNKFSLIEFAENFFKMNPEAHKSGDKNPEQILEEKEQFAIVRKEIDRLPEKQRIALILSKYDELPQKEIAEIMGISVGAVEQHLQRAKTTLEKKLKNLVGK